MRRALMQAHLRARMIFGLVVGGVAATMIPGVAYAATAQLLFKLTAPEPLPGGGFGEVLTVVDGDILVGEPRRVENGVQGRAYLFDGETGGFKLALNNPQPRNLDIFARAVTGGDGQIYVTTSGLQYRVYGFDAMSGEMTLRIEKPAGAGSSFGLNMAYGEGNLLVGDPSFSIPFGMQSVGRGYLFDVTDGSLEHTLVNPQPNTNDTLGGGISATVFGDKVALGAVGDNSFAGSVWVYNRLTGATLFRIDNPTSDSRLLDFFGWSVAANSDIIVVGANEDDSSGMDGAGSVFVFSASDGKLLHTLFSPQLESNGEFGRSIALTPRGDILVGAFGTSVDGIEGAGRAYVFDGESGNLLLDIPNPHPTQFAAFGWRVAGFENRLVIGGPAAGIDDLPATGAVYVFRHIPEPDTFILMSIVAVNGTFGVRGPRAQARERGGGLTPKFSMSDG